VFVVPAEGGVPQRLTWHPNPDVTLGWSRDGRKVLFSSSRSSYSRVTELYLASLDGGLEEKLPLPMGYERSLSPDAPPGRRRRESICRREFEMTTDDQLATLNEALFETAHFIGALASADGAVVMTKQHDSLGFGGMISGRLPAVRTVARALDVEGDRVADEGTDNVGARHRSAYQLAAAFPGAVVIVISQDGGVRFVAQKGGRVT
jgi:hypothetical protein